VPREGYTSVSIPDEMVREIDLVVKQKKYGYSSRADFIADAIRRLQRELKPLQK
jgi:metal-responsive CopG/Arc/MetJ family transcriptional regulator